MSRHSILKYLNINFTMMTNVKVATILKWFFSNGESNELFDVFDQTIHKFLISLIGLIALFLTRINNKVL